MASGDTDATNPHDLAVDIQQDLQKLAVMLAHAGAAPQAVAQLTKMAEIIGQVVKVLGAGPPLPGAQGPPAPGGPPGPPQAGPPQPQGPPPPGPPQAGPPQPAPTPQQQSIHHAVGHLHQAMIQSAQQRRA